MKKAMKSQKRYAEGGKVFGGMLGNAEKGLKSRTSRLDAALDEATRGTGGKGGTGGTGGKASIAKHKTKPNPKR